MAVEFKRVAPILTVRNVDVALAHYRRLGFEGTVYKQPEQDGSEYGFLSRGAVTLHLAQVESLDPKRTTSACYLYVSDADTLYATWQAADVGGRLTTPADTPYGLREFAHIDPDGNLLRIGSPLPESHP
jgi:uncharacterized glyoxalase superfamily protein PhnB